MHVPLRVRVAVGHAAAQLVADRTGVDVLHIKGPALDDELVWDGREGTDADVLVRPSHAPAYVAALEAEGWELRSHFENSSVFEHSATLWHDLWGYVDVHRYFPGISVDAETAFERLWEDRETQLIADYPCAVPSVVAQVLILVLHAARGGGSPRAAEDVRTSWVEASPQRRADVAALCRELRADVAFAAGTGHLDDFRGAREYELWSVVSRGGTRVQEWRARVKAAPTRRAALRVVLRAPLVNVEHLAMVRGHRPSRREVAVEFFARPVRGLREGWAIRRGRRMERA